MKFRPCIDIHNGKVKQLVGGSLRDEGDTAKENFVAKDGGAYFADRYQKDGLKGGHIIILNHKGSKYYEESRAQAVAALKAYPGGMQIGGGMDAENAKDYISAGASHVIVTSYVFRNGQVDFENLDRMVKTVGKEKLVLDLSCRKRNDRFFIVTDRWQKFTDIVLNNKTLDFFAEYCDEFLVHGVDVEGKGSGMDEGLVKILSDWKERNPERNAITYAGGISSKEDIERFAAYCNQKLDFTIGSALDVFGGKLSYESVVRAYGRSL